MAHLEERRPWVALEDDEDAADETKRRGWFWTATIGFAVFVVVFPTVMLAATGHFSPHSGSSVDNGPALGTNHDIVGIGVPSLQPSQATPSPTTLYPTISPSVSLDPTLPGETRQPSDVPSVSPSTMPSRSPTERPTAQPTRAPTPSPTPAPIPVIQESSVAPVSLAPTTAQPTSQPTPGPTSQPTPDPTLQPTQSPPTTISPTLFNVTYQPGDLTVNMLNLYMSTGLSARIVARHRQKVQLHGGGLSKEKFHERPDFGATFRVPDDDTTNPGGWVYVSNSEMLTRGQGGVGAVYFDQYGNTLDYKMLLNDTTWNCGGGPTPWHTWVSCEEWGNNGQIYQVDPFGRRTSAKLTMGRAGGRWESFSYDVRNKNKPKFFATEDHELGALRRFTADSPNWDDPWTMLHGNGTMDYLVLEPDGNDGGTFRWVNSLGTAKNNAKLYYPNTEGIDVKGSYLYMVSKVLRQLYILDLDNLTYKIQSTRSGLFDGTPDQVQHILDDHDILYFTEEGGRDAGVHGRDNDGRYFTIFESREYPDETTGLAFSPDGRHMYVAYQETGILYDITRDDGLPFNGRSLNVKYHAPSAGRRRRSL